MGAITVTARDESGPPLGRLRRLATALAIAAALVAAAVALAARPSERPRA